MQSTRCKTRLDQDSHFLQVSFLATHNYDYIAFLSLLATEIQNKIG